MRGLPEGGRTRSILSRARRAPRLGNRFDRDPSWVLLDGSYPLLLRLREVAGEAVQAAGPALLMCVARRHRLEEGLMQRELGLPRVLGEVQGQQRSEEHTSELQSRG